jgi:hypothetical protein
MGTPFFEEEWERLDDEALARARIRVVAFTEATTDARLRMQLQSAFRALEPLQNAIRSQNRHLLVSFLKAVCLCLLKKYGQVIWVQNTHRFRFR